MPSEGSAATTEPAKPRSKTIVRVLLGIHIVITTVFSVELILGVWRGLPRVEAAPAPADAASCVSRARELHEELMARLAAVPRATPAVAEARSFERWSALYRVRLAEATEACRAPSGVDAAKAEAIAEAFRALGKLHDRGEVAAGHWSRHAGPVADETRAAFDRLR